MSPDDFLPDLKQIGRMFADFKQEYNDDRLRTQAKGDAEAGMPRANSSEHSPFEVELAHAASDLANQVAAKFRSALEILDARIKADTQRINAEHEHEVEHLSRQHGVKSEALENSFGLNDAHRQLEKVDSRYDQMLDKHGRIPVKYVPHWLYIIFATAIFLGEIPLNAIVFQIFGENQIMTWVMAFVIGLCVPLTAHFIGIKLREHGDGFHLANTLKALAVFVVIAIALYGLSLMRQTYLGEFKKELGLTDLLVERSFLFFWLNMAVFVAAIIVSYLAHDSVPGFEGLAHHQSRTRKNVSREEKKRVHELLKVNEEMSKAKHKANQRYRDAMAEVTMLKGVYDQILKEGQSHESRCVEVLGLLLSIYRNENLARRSDKEEPPCFRKKIEIPLQLRTLKEKLLNDEGAHEPNTAA